MDLQVESVAVPGIIPPAENRIDGPDVASIYIPGPAGLAVLRAVTQAAASAAAAAVSALAASQSAQRTAAKYIGSAMHIAHRGYSGHSIENTMTAFSKAIQYRADALELDVQISSDGVPVVIHDLTVDYSTTSTGNVKDFTAAELRAMTRDARYGAIYEKSYIPTFAEVITLAKNHQIQIWPEVKGYRTTDDIALMVQAVIDAGYEHMTKFQSFNFTDLPIVRALSSTVALGHTNGATDFRTYADDLLALGGECWIITSILKAYAHPEYVRELQDRGIKLAFTRHTCHPTWPRLKKQAWTPSSVIAI